MSERFAFNKPALPAAEKMLEPLAAVLGSGRLTNGQRVEALEEQVARFCQVQHAVAVANGTIGLMMAAEALGVGGEIIVPAFTFVATGQGLAWGRRGATMVFADVDPHTFTLDVAAAEAAIGPRTEAICAVNVFGVPPDLHALEALAARHGLALLVDSAQGFGARWDGRPTGGFGHLEVFSLSPVKVLTAAEGGLLTTNDGALAQRLRQMRDYGRVPAGQTPAALGLNGRMSEVHAVIAAACLQEVPAQIAARRRHLAAYRQALAGQAGVRMQQVPASAETNGTFAAIALSAPHQADALAARLDDLQVETRRYFWPALHHQPANALWGGREGGPLPVTEELERRCIALPLYASMGPSDCAEIAARLAEALSRD